MLHLWLLLCVFVHDGCICDFLFVLVRHVILVTFDHLSAVPIVQMMESRCSLLSPCIDMTELCSSISDPSIIIVVVIIIILVIIIIIIIVIIKISNSPARIRGRR